MLNASERALQKNLAVSNFFLPPYMAKRKKTFPELEFGGRVKSGLGQFAKPSRRNAASLQTQEREAVEVPLPNFDARRTDYHVDEADDLRRSALLRVRHTGAVVHTRRTDTSASS